MSADLPPKMTQINQRIVLSSIIWKKFKYNKVIDEKLMVKKMQSLCEDNHWEVRRNACYYLKKIVTKRSYDFFVEIMELIDDEEAEVAELAAGLIQDKSAIESFLQKVFMHPQKYDFSKFIENLCKQPEKIDLK